MTAEHLHARAVLREERDDGDRQRARTLRSRRRTPGRLAGGPARRAGRSRRPRRAPRRAAPQERRTRPASDIAAVTATIEATAAAASRPWARHRATPASPAHAAIGPSEIAGVQQRRERIAMRGRVAEPRVPHGGMRHRTRAMIATIVASPPRIGSASTPARARHRCDQPGDAADRDEPDVARIEDAGEQRRSGGGQRRRVRRLRARELAQSRTAPAAPASAARTCGATARRSITPSVAPPAAAIAPTSAGPRNARIVAARAAPQQSNGHGYDRIARGRERGACTRKPEQRDHVPGAHRGHLADATRRGHPRANF